MLKHIILKEILDHLKSLRLMLSLLLLIVLMVVSAVLYIPDYHQSVNDFAQNRNESLEQTSQLLNNRMVLFTMYSFRQYVPYIYRMPNHLAFISEGHDKDLPNAFRVSAFRIWGPEKRLRTNILLWRSESIDWVLIIGIVLSFASFILVYDAICGEKEEGTLRLNLANSVPRSTWIFGKFLGALFTLTSTLAIGILLNLIILIVFGKIPIHGMDWGIIGLAFIFSVLYISVFLMLGLSISSLCKETSTSLVVSLLCWAILVIFIPRLGGLISSKITHIPRVEEVLNEAWSAREEAVQIYNDRNPHVSSSFMSGQWSPGEPLERALVAGDAWSEVMNEYRNKMVRQVEIAQYVTLISPTSCFQYGIETLTESGIHHYKRYFRQARDFRLATKQFLLDIYPLPLKWHRWDERIMEQEKTADEKKLGALKLDFESIPKFQEKRNSMDKLFATALPYFLILFLFNALFFTAAFVKFLRYDVR